MLLIIGPSYGPPEYGNQDGSMGKIGIQWARIGPYVPPRRRTWLGLAQGGLPAPCGWWASGPLFWDGGQNPDLENELGYDPKRPRIPHPLVEFPVVM